MAKQNGVLKAARFGLVAILIALAGFMAAFAATVGPASAAHKIVNTIAGIDSTNPCANMPVNTACVSSLSFSGMVLGGRASASDIDTGRVTVLADMNLRAGVKINRKNCITTKAGEVWWSGGWGVNGKAFEKETTPGTLCRSKKSKTGWVKVGGGKTGRKCFNEAEVGRIPPGPIAKGKIIWVSSLAKVKMHLRAKAAVSLRAVCGTASASGFADIVVSLVQFVRTRGNMQGRIRIAGSAVGKATASAKAELNCTVAPTTTVVTTAPPPPGTTTVVTTTTPPANRPPTIRIQCPAHLFSKGKAVIWVYVSDPDGDPLGIGFQRPQLGSFSGTFPHATEAGRWGNEYTAPENTGPGDIMVTLIATVSDGKNPAVSTKPADCTFPVKKDDFGG